MTFSLRVQGKSGRKKARPEPGGWGYRVRVLNHISE
jgi:hypothetical protein